MLVALPWLRNFIRQAQPAVTQVGEWQPVLLTTYLNDIGYAFRERVAFVSFGWLQWGYAIMYVMAFLTLALTNAFPKVVRVWIGMTGIVVVLVLFLPWRCLLSGLGLDPYKVSRMMDIVGRALNLFPPALVITILLGHMLGCPIGSQQTQRRCISFKSLVFGAIIVLALTVYLFPSASRIRMMLEYGPNVRPRFEFVYADKPEMFRRLKGKVLLSDAWTSYMTQYVLGFWCVTTPAGHSSAIIDVNGRSMWIRDFFAGRLPDRQVAEFLTRHRCEYVLLNRHLAERREILHFERFAIEYDQVNWAYLDHLQLVQKVFEDADIVLYEVKHPG